MPLFVKRPRIESLEQNYLNVSYIPASKVFQHIRLKLKVFADYFLVSNTCGSGATSQQHAALAAVMSQLNKAQNKE